MEKFIITILFLVSFFLPNVVLSGTYTPYHNFYKIDYGEGISTWWDDVNHNWDIVDKYLAKTVDAGQYASLNAAVSANPNKTILVTSTMPLSANLTVPSGTSLHVYPGGYITKASTYTITINGGFYADSKVFDGFGTADITFGGNTVNYLKPKYWGAVGDGSTDDTEAIQAAINCAARSGIGEVRFGAGQYNFTKLYLHYDTVDNPNFPNSSVIQGKITLSGTGCLRKNNYTSSTKKTILYSTDATGPAIEVEYNITKNVYNLGIKDLTIIAENTTQVVKMHEVSNNSIIDRVFIVQKGSGDGLLWEGMWLSSIRDLSVLKSTLNQTGKGVVIENLTSNNGTDGQVNDLTQIVVLGFDVGITLGSDDYDDSKLLGAVNFTCGNTVDCNYGVVLGRAENVTISGFQCEGDYTETGIKIGGGSGNIKIQGCRLKAKTSGVAIGYGSATVAANAAISRVVQVENNYILGAADSFIGVNVNAVTSAVHNITIQHNRIFGGGFATTTGIAVSAKNAAIELGSNVFTNIATQIDNPYNAAIYKHNNGFVHYYFDNKLWTTGTSTPSVGTRTWAVGDVIVNTAPTNSSAKAWMCTTAGDPGTWTAFCANGGATGSKPTLGSADIGFTYYNTTTSKLNVWDGSAWKLYDGSAP